MQIENLDHLGLVAALVDELGLVELSDKLLGTHKLQPLDSKWVPLVRLTAVDSVDSETPTDAIAEELQEFWRTFLKNDLPKINAAVFSISIADST